MKAALDAVPAISAEEALSLVGSSDHLFVDLRDGTEQAKTGLALLSAGGALYSLGVVFHLWERLPYQNAIWHAFVLAAPACHFTAVFSEMALAG